MTARLGLARALARRYNKHCEMVSAAPQLMQKFYRKFRMARTRAQQARHGPGAAASCVRCTTYECTRSYARCRHAALALPMSVAKGWCAA